eukprot:TRINITY_DN8703_c0_g1_i1.p1 TRINITY_DN8703_c0_g1~~TRINITY_DN8703_c0_g1_i1.p1  ORF type:complete len:520 (+),score=170.87 TRINITY_DN8703_c0_g1_i1:1497-3056(+)
MEEEDLSSLQHSFWGENKPQLNHELVSPQTTNDSDDFLLDLKKKLTLLEFDSPKTPKPTTTSSTNKTTLSPPSTVNETTPTTPLVDFQREFADFKKEFMDVKREKTIEEILDEFKSSYPPPVQKTSTPTSPLFEARATETNTQYSHTNFDTGKTVKDIMDEYRSEYQQYLDDLKIHMKNAPILNTASPTITTPPSRHEREQPFSHQKPPLISTRTELNQDFWKPFETPHTNSPKTSFSTTSSNAYNYNAHSPPTSPQYPILYPSHTPQSLPKAGNQNHPWNFQRFENVPNNNINTPQPQQTTSTFPPYEFLFDHTTSQPQFQKNIQMNANYITNPHQRLQQTYFSHSPNNFTPTPLHNNNRNSPYTNHNTNNIPLNQLPQHNNFNPHTQFVQNPAIFSPQLPTFPVQQLTPPVYTVSENVKLQVQPQQPQQYQQHHQQQRVNSENVIKQTHSTNAPSGIQTQTDSQHSHTQPHTKSKYVDVETQTMKSQPSTPLKPQAVVSTQSTGDSNVTSKCVDPTQ